MKPVALSRRTRPNLLTLDERRLGQTEKDQYRQQLEAEEWRLAGNTIGTDASVARRKHQRPVLKEICFSVIRTEPETSFNRSDFSMMRIRQSTLSEAAYNHNMQFFFGITISSLYLRFCRAGSLIPRE